MPKINLPQVTLVCIGSDHLIEAEQAVKVCTNFCNFGNVLHLKDVIDNDNNPHLQYNDFVINNLADVVEELVTETTHCLIVQWDGFILNPSAWSDEWLKYDYIGAPWGLNDPNGVGNGGFSLRSLELMKLMQQLGLPPEECRPEDTVICQKHRQYLIDNGCVFATPEEGNKFSVETNSFHPAIKWDGQFGFHNIYTNGVQAKIDQVKKLLNG